MQEVFVTCFRCVQIPFSDQVSLMNMPNKILLRMTALAMVAGALSFSPNAVAQIPNNWTNGSNTGVWNDIGNWSLGGVPEAQFDEQAFVTNGDTVLVTTNVSETPGEIIIAGESTLQVTATGSLATSAAGLPEGDIQIGQEGGAGTVVVESGGSIVAARRLQEFGPADSLLDLLGTASVTVVDEATLDRRTRITGPAVSFSAGSLHMGNATSFEPVITGGTHSVIQVTGNAQLDGDLRADLSGAGPLSAGQTWDLITAGTISGNFDSVVETTGSLLPGQSLFTQNVSSGTTAVQLSIVQELYLEVNSDTGTVAIKSSDSTPIPLDGYAIQSAGQHLNPSTWNSLSDQSTPQWIEATATRQRLSEVQLSGTTGVTDSFSLSLPGAFDPQPSAIGEAIDDLTFTYTSAEGTVTGEVLYTGVSIANDMTLIVDATGAAQIKNASGFAINIEGYQISTAAGVFDDVGWNSLNEQSVGGWVEANPTTSLLTEVDIEGSTHFFEGQAFNIGDLFAGAVPTDLIFSYAKHGESAFTVGKVLNQDLPALPSFPGDFDNDGDVDGDDLSGGALSWESRYGVDLDGADFLAWQRTFGLTSGSLAAATATVPEPTGLNLLAILFLHFFSQRRRDWFSLGGAGHLGLSMVYARRVSQSRCVRKSIAR